MSDRNTASASGGGMGLAGIVTVVFVVLKLLAVNPVAHWSWIWVFSPLWISLALFVGLGLLLLVAAGLYAAFKS